MSLKKHSSTIQKNQSTAQDDLFMKPDPTKVTGMRHGSYDKINDKGFAPEETVINNNDVIICKVSPIQPVYSDTEKKEVKIYKDNSEAYKGYASGVVDKVWTNIYNTEGYQMIKTRTRSERVPRTGDKFCVNEKTEALTSSGWKYVKDLQMTDKIAVLENDKLAYANPIGIYNRDYNGKMYELNSTYVRFAVTYDHELYVKPRGEKTFRHMSAESVVGKTVSYKTGGVETDNVHQEYFTLPGCDNYSEKQLNMNDWLVFFGIWITEGLSEEITTINVNKQYVKDTIKQVCDKLDFNIIKKGDNLHIDCVQLVKYLQTINKQLPDFVWTLNVEQSRILINSIQSDDKSYYTSSKQLADDLQRLCLHAKWSAMISETDLLCVNINRNNLEPQVKPNNISESVIESVYDYNGKVYCLEVPSHVFMMRYNGKISFCGQCSRHGQKG